MDDRLELEQYVISKLVSCRELLDVAYNKLVITQQGVLIEKNKDIIYQILNNIKIVEYESLIKPLVTLEHKLYKNSSINNDIIDLLISDIIYRIILCRYYVYTDYARSYISDIDGILADDWSDSVLGCNVKVLINPYERDSFHCTVSYCKMPLATNIQEVSNG